MPELQEAWGQAEAAWQCLPPQPAGADDGGEAEVAEADARQEEAASADQQAQPPFGEACLSASRAWAAAGEGAAAGFSDAAAVLQLLEGAPQRLQGLDPDDFPRLLEWSGGLCGLTLLPLRCVGGLGAVLCCAQVEAVWAPCMYGTRLTNARHTPPCRAACLRAICLWKPGCTAAPAWSRWPTSGFTGCPTHRPSWTERGAARQTEHVRCYAAPISFDVLLI